MARVRRKFNDELKQEAVRLVTARGFSMAQAARDLRIRVNLFRTWVRTATRLVNGRHLMLPQLLHEGTGLREAACLDTLLA